VNDRLTELEIQLAHVQRLYDQLDEVVTQQAMRLDRMQRRLEAVETQVKELKEKSQTTTDPLDETPPHY
jgi:SlyX protein